MPGIPKKQFDWFRVTIGVVTLIFLCLGIVWFMVHRAAKVPTQTLSLVATSTSVRFRSFLDGSPVDTADQETPRVVGVMIDNHPDARPEAGISLARVVYEAPVEGGFTRYFALFNASSTVDKVGPVRSARPYFLDWLEEYGAITPMYMHSGGSPDALAEIAKRGIFDANEFYWGEYYWRSSEADPPHNLFTKSDLWQSFLEKFGDRRPAGTWHGWIFGDVSATASSTVTAVSIYYTPDYVVGWQYDEKSGQYRRLINGKVSSDREGRAVLADNIIILEMPVQVIDEEGRKVITTIGTNVARVLRHGDFIRGIWKKNTATDRTRVFDANSNEVTLVPGITWVEIIPLNTSVEVTQ